MVTKVTNGIKISVKSNFTGSFYEKAILKYCFEYIVEIENNSNEVVHLDRRQWYIYDSLNNIESVYGEGVVGEKFTNINLAVCFHLLLELCLATMR